MSAGKGSKPRPTHLPTFRDNHDRIFGAHRSDPIHTMQLRYGQSVIATDQSTFPEASAPEQISGINNARPVGAGNSLHNVESIHPETKK